MPLRTVTYDLHSFSGDTPAVGASLKVKLLKTFATSTQTYDAGEVTAIIDSDGAGVFNLAVPETGTAIYQFTLPSKKSYKVALADGPDTTLEALINAAASVAVPQNTVQMAIDAEAAARIEADEAIDRRIDNLVITGGGDATYRHVQSSPASTWTVTHGLNKRVSVSIVDSAGDLVLGNVNYASDNQITIGFSAAFAGEAYCN